MTFETAQAFAVGAFRALHSKIPHWLPSYSMISGTRDEMERWVIFLTVVPKETLEPNYFWEELNGERMLVNIDPITGQKGYVIHRAPREVITIFKATVDPETAEVTVLVDKDLSSISQDDLEGCDNDPKTKINYKSLWLSPVKDLSFEQLRMIKKVFDFHDLNILEMKKKYSNGERHLLCDGIHPEDAKEKAKELSRFSIPFFIQEETKNP